MGTMVYRLTCNASYDSIVKIEHFDESKGFHSLQNNKIFKINQQIVFSTGNGFYNYNAKENKIQKSQLLTKLFGTPFFSKKLLETPKGNIWCYSLSSMIYALKKGNNTYSIDSISFSGLKNKLISGFEQMSYINDSSYIVGTEDGFSWINIHLINSEHNRFKLSISGIYTTNEGDSLMCGFVSQKDSDKYKTFIWKNNSIRFEFVGTEYQVENCVVYSFMLENYNNDWSQYSTVNNKEYTNLPKGDYIFKVRAKNIFSSETAEISYRFTILPPWYQSNLAFAIYLFIVLLTLYFLVQKFKKHLEKGAREMEALKEVEIKEQEKRFKLEAKEKEIIALKNQKLQYELRHKSQDLASSTMNLIRKNEILLEISQNLDKIGSELGEKNETISIVWKIRKMQDEIKNNVEHDHNWKKFQDNFDLVYENYLKRLSENYPILTNSDKKLCAYLKMNLSSKDIAPLLNMYYRSVEMSRYRLRKKMELDRDK